jgi:hypothetical protein
VEEVLRRLGSLRLDMVAMAGVAVATLLLAVAFAVALVSGSARLSSVAAIVTFLLIVAVGLYASRLGAPGRST